MWNRLLGPLHYEMGGMNKASVDYPDRHENGPNCLQVHYCRLILFPFFITYYRFWRWQP